MVGGDMDLADHAETMSLDGRSGGIVMPGLDELQRRQVLYVNLFPNLLVSLHPDVSDPPHRPRHAGHEPGRVPVAVPA